MILAPAHAFSIRDKSHEAVRLLPIVENKGGVCEVTQVQDVKK